MGLPVPQLQLQVIVLSSGDDTEVNGMGRVEEGVGFQVDTGEGICCSIAGSLDVANVRRELGDVVQVSDLPGGEAV